MLPLTVLVPPAFGQDDRALGLVLRRRFGVHGAALVVTFACPLIVTSTPSREMLPPRVHLHLAGTALQLNVVAAFDVRCAGHRT